MLRRYPRLGSSMHPPPSSGPSSAADATPYQLSPSGYAGPPPIASSSNPGNVIYPPEMPPISSTYWQQPPPPVAAGQQPIAIGDVFYPGFNNVENAEYYDPTLPSVPVSMPTSMASGGQLQLPSSSQQFVPNQAQLHPPSAHLPVIQGGNGYQGQQIIPGAYNHPSHPIDWAGYPMPAPASGAIHPDPTSYGYIAPSGNPTINNGGKQCFYESPYPTMPPPTAAYPTNSMLPMPDANGPPMYNNMPLTSDNNQNTPIACPSRPVKAASAAPSDGGSGGDEPKDVNRRLTNNTRERIRVRDINTNFKELQEMIKQHKPTIQEKALTKLGILHEATELITYLDNEVRRRNLTHKIKFNAPK